MNIKIGPRGGRYIIINGNKRYLTNKQSSFGKKVITKRTNQPLWEEIVECVKKSNKGGRPNQWSARKAQISVRIYKQLGGGYIGSKNKSNSLTKWTNQKWRTKSGRNSIIGKNASGERYLPDSAIKSLSKSEYNKTTKEKKKATRSGKQFSKQPKKVAKKVKKYRQ